MLKGWFARLGGRYLIACAAVLLAVPAAAAAVTGRVDRLCYSHVPLGGSQPVVVSLTGGTPGADFIVSATVPGKGLGSAGFAQGTFDAAGSGKAEIQDVAPPSATIGPTRGQPIKVSVEDFGAGGTEVPIGQILVTTLAMSVSDTPESSRARRVVSVSGTLFARRRVYGFIVGRTGHRVLRRFAIGIGDVCGFARTRAVVAPSDDRPGNYRLYVNAGSRLDKRHALYVSFHISHR